MSTLKRFTCFIDDAIGIDPPNCGCTDCIVGDSIPISDSSTIEELIEAHFEEGREVLNRTYYNMVIYMDESNHGAWIYDDGYNAEIIPTDAVRYEEYDVAEDNPIIIIHPQDHDCETCRNGESIPANASTKFDNAYLRNCTKGARLYNESGHPLLVSHSYGAYSYEVTPIEARDEYSIEVLLK